VLCCAVLCCAVLCCAVLCCAVLCCAVLCCAVLWYAMFRRLMSSQAVLLTPVPSSQMMWCFSHGSAVVRVVFADRWRDLRMSTAQAAVIMWFNSRRTMTFEQLHSCCGLDKPTLKCVLASMTQVKGLKVIKKRREGSGIKDDDEFEVDYSYRNPKHVRSSPRIADVVCVLLLATTFVGCAVGRCRCWHSSFCLESTCP
jgi:hypothetical protein